MNNHSKLCLYNDTVFQRFSLSSLTFWGRRKIRHFEDIAAGNMGRGAQNRI